MGRELIIPALAEVEKTLWQVMGTALSAEFSLDSEPVHMARVLAKYGILDLAFITSVPLLGSDDQISWDALRTLHLAVGQGQLDEGIEFVEQELRDDACFLRVFLTCAPLCDAIQLRTDKARSMIAGGVAPHLAYEAALDEMAKNIAKEFPLAFVIDDACLTNSRWIWTNKYFYL